MAKKPEVICLYCNKKFYREDVDFKQVGRRYAHAECVDLIDKLFLLLEDKLKEDFSPTKVRTQINKLTKEEYSLQDIYDTMYWWYEIKKEDPSKANGGIGIFSYVYPDFVKYKNNQERISNLNKGKKVEDYIGESVSYTIKPTPIRRPRIKLFGFE